jgi:putative SOS response-associated peptidase YedK
MRRFAQAIADSLPPGLPADVCLAIAAAPDRYNVGKGKPATVIARIDDQIVVTDMQWGLIPRWSKEPATPYTTVTARLNKAPGSRIYAKAWKQRHCVVPMSGYYKWDRQRKPPWPRFVQRRDGLALLAAGLWEHWEQDGLALDSFSLLTGPNPTIPAPLTADGPVFLEPASALEWLAGTLTSPGALERYANRVNLESYPVSRAIRDPQRDDFTLLEPAEPDAPSEIEAQDLDIEDDE